MRSIYIYALGLENGKYYIGKTKKPFFRLKDHFNIRGSKWTKLHKPIKLLQLIPNCDNYDEDKYTLIYMDRYGIDNVRGGSFTTIKLNDSTKDHLMKMSNSINNRCFKCGKSGHFSKDCKEFEYVIIPHDEIYKETMYNKNIIYCYRCGRKDHFSTSCRSKKHINGYDLNVEYV
jgi:hypothetical protein